MQREQKKIFRVLAAVVAAGVLFAVWHFSQPARKEPVYQGTTLTKWLRELDDGQAFGISSYELPSPTQRQLKAARAIQAMGAAALPFLMEDIHARPAENAPRIRLARWAGEHLPRWLSSHFYEPATLAEDRTRWRAGQGLAALGPLAKPALPELERLLYTNIWHSSIKEAAYALATLGPEGVRVLTNSVQPQSEWSGMCAIWALGQHPAAGTNCIPFLISATSSRSEGTAEGAIEVLGLLHVDAPRVISVLTNVLAGTNTALRQCAAVALGHYRRQASAALPLLETMTNDAAISNEALRAWRQIR